MKKHLQYLAVFLLLQPLLAQADWVEALKNANKVLDIINKNKKEQSQPAPSPTPSPAPTQTSAPPASQPTSQAGAETSSPTSTPAGTSSQKQTVFVAAGTPAEATKHQGFERVAVLRINPLEADKVSEYEKVAAIVSNPYMPQTPLRRTRKTKGNGPLLKTGFFGRIDDMQCGENNSLIVDGYTMNEAAEEQMGTWRIAENGAITALNVRADTRQQYVKNHIIKYKNGTTFTPNFPVTETFDGKVFKNYLNKVETAYDANTDEVVMSSVGELANNGVYYTSIFTLWRQSADGSVRRVIRWRPLGNIGGGNDLLRFYAREPQAVAVKDGSIYVAIRGVDADASIAIQDLVRIPRTVVYRVDESNKKLIPIFDQDIEKVYKSRKWSVDHPDYEKRGAAFFTDGKLNTAYYNDTGIGSICFDQQGNLYMLNSAGLEGSYAAIRKIDFSKNEMTTWAY